ncbi:hypothetical protein AAMO2058_000569800 [Amorphochlora amoebiformis]
MSEFELEDPVISGEDSDDIKREKAAAERRNALDEQNMRTESEMKQLYEAQAEGEDDQYALTPQDMDMYESGLKKHDNEETGKSSKFGESVMMAEALHQQQHTTQMNKSEGSMIDVLLSEMLKIDGLFDNDGEALFAPNSTIERELNKLSNSQLKELMSKNSIYKRQKEYIAKYKKRAEEFGWPSDTEEYQKAEVRFWDEFHEYTSQFDPLNIPKNFTYDKMPRLLTPEETYAKRQRQKKELGGDDERKNPFEKVDSMLYEERTFASDDAEAS